jgi:hypothetical protein
VLQAKRHVLLHDRKNNLVVWILKQKPNLLANGIQMLSHRQPIAHHSPSTRDEQTVDKPSKRTFTRTVGTDNPNPRFGQTNIEFPKDGARTSLNGDGFELDYHDGCG